MMKKFLQLLKQQGCTFCKKHNIDKLNTGLKQFKSEQKW